MDEMIKLILSLSLSASVIAAMLFALKPLYQHRLSKSWQYYIWLVVVIRLLVPVTFEQNLIGGLFARAEGAAAAQQISVEPLPEAMQMQEITIEQITVNEPPKTPAAATREESPHTGGPTWDNLWLLWFAPALVLLARKVTSYHSFARFIKAGRVPITDSRDMAVYQRVCQDMGMTKPLPLYRNKLASSPMLVGILRPCIVLPEMDVGDEELAMVLRHELVHYKRQDILYKWLVQLATCIHWFNPMMYLAAREISRNCELSCDEAVIAGMARDDMRRYGDTLLATLQTGGTYGDAVASVTLSEDGRQLKERLSAIVKFRPSSKTARITAVSLSVLLLCFAAYMGAYAGMTKDGAGETVTLVEDVPAIVLRDDAYVFVTEVDRNGASQATFRTDSNHTVLYMAQDGKGDFSITVAEKDTGKTVMKHDSVTFDDGEEPVFVSGIGRGTYTLDVTAADTAVTVYAAGVDEAEDYKKLTLDNILTFSGNLAESIVRDITEDLGLSSIWNEDAWLDYWDGWEDKWDQWETGWEKRAGEIEKKWEDRAAKLEEKYADKDERYYDNWKQLHYNYQDGYLVGVGIKAKDSPDNYKTKISIEVNGTQYTVGIPDEYASYATNTRVLDNLRKSMGEILQKRSYAGTELFAVRSIVYDTNADSLLRSTYEKDRFVEFVEMLEYCQGKVIEDLLYKSFDDDASIHFTLLAEKLPKGFDGEDLARKAAAKKDIVMLSAMGDYIDSQLLDKLTMECLDLPDFDAMFD